VDLTPCGDAASEEAGFHGEKVLTREAAGPEHTSFPRMGEFNFKK
jgi:hypothetical protein